MKVTVEATTKEIKKTEKGTVYTGLKLSTGEWVNMGGNHLDLKGKTINITEPKTYGNSKWVNLEKEESEPPRETEYEYEKPGGSTKPPPSPAPRPPRSHKPLAEYLHMMDQLYKQMRTLEIDASARAILVNGALAAWLEGKIT